MPKDIIDGIHTRRGRVVYNRKKHVWTVKDIRRVVDNALPREIPRSDSENEPWFQIYWGIIKKLLEFLLNNPESNYALAILAMIVKTIDSTISVCGDDKPKYKNFGGAGATRTFGE